MNRTLPRLSREETRNILDRVRSKPLDEISRMLPITDTRTRSSALGGTELGSEFLSQVRADLLELAREYGFPSDDQAASRFDAICARYLHQQLRISPHEAAEEDAWSYLTCVWLLDIAVWRWGGTIGTSDRRFRGDVNRNTFRRLWWRAEVLGPGIDLSLLGEDEIVSIMERPILAANLPLSRTLAAQFIDRVRDEGSAGRMIFMREACKHLVRLTPIVDFYSLDQSELEATVDAVFTSVREGGSPPVVTPSELSAEPSEAVERLDSWITEVGPDFTIEGDTDGHVNSEIAEIALRIAARTGRVTNTMLREDTGLASASARQVLQALVDQGRLSRRGRKRGTYYVIAKSDV